MDLANKKKLLSRSDTNEMNHYFLTTDLYDPIIEIRYCDCFREARLEIKEILFDEVLPGIQSKIKNATVLIEGHLAYGSGFSFDDGRATLGLLHGEVVFRHPDPDKNHPIDKEEEKRRIELLDNFLDEQARHDGHN